MINLKPVIFAISALWASSSAIAGYAQLAPPSGFQSVSQNVGGVPTKFMFTKAANDSIVRNAANQAFFRTTATLNVAGRSVVVPAAMRFAANSGIFLARSAFPHPALFLALGAAGLAYKYFTDQGITVEGDKWVRKGIKIDRYSWYCSPANGPNLSACVAWACSLYGNPQGCIARTTDSMLQPGEGWRGTCWDRVGYAPPDDVSCGMGLQRGEHIEEFEQSTPLTLPELEQALANKPIPAGAPEGWPMALPPLPIETPIINPYAEPSLAPNPNPLTIPTGAPQPVVPATDPATYRQPVTEVTPANNEQNPWRVNTEPKFVVDDTPETVTDPTGDPETDPVIDPNPDPGTDPNTTTEPVPDPGICDEYPDILACAKLGEAQAPKIPSKEVAVKVTPKTFSGGAGSCPAPLTFTFMTHTGEISYQPLCDQLSLLRALFLALAGVMAAYILADSFKVQ